MCYPYKKLFDCVISDVPHLLCDVCCGPDPALHVLLAAQCKACNSDSQNR